MSSPLRKTFTGERRYIPLLDALSTRYNLGWIGIPGECEDIAKSLGSHSVDEGHLLFDESGEATAVGALSSSDLVLIQRFAQFAEAAAELGGFYTTCSMVRGLITRGAP